jgi:serine/threonine-protein kinase
LACFHESIDIAPQFALPYTGIADIHIMSGLYGFKQPKESFPLALANAEKAVQLDPEAAEAHTSRGSVRMFHDWDFAGAEEDYLRAIELNPSYATTYLAYGDLMWVFERGEEAVEQIREAVRLDPLDLGMNMNLGDFLYFGGRFAESAEQHRKVLAMNPRFFPSRARLAKALACAGDRDGAHATLDELKATAPEAVFLETAAVTHGILGERDEARAMLDEWKRVSTGYVSPLPVAWAYGALGDQDAAIEWLEKSLDERSPALIVSHVQPAFRSLVDDPRYRDILDRIGIPASSAQLAGTGDGS